MRHLTVDIPIFVVIPTSVLGGDGSIGLVVSAWRNTIQVIFFGADKKEHLGNYTVRSHIIKAPTPADWDNFRKVWDDEHISKDTAINSRVE